jgi:voltage-gated potassium channel
MDEDPRTAEPKATPGRRQILYEAFLACLALTSLFLAVGEERGVISLQVSAWLDEIDLLIWLVFAGDYAARLRRAKDRGAFFLHNWIELIALIPFHPAAKALRGLRILRILQPNLLLRTLSILRLTAYFGRAYGRLRNFLTRNNFHYVLVSTIMVILLGAASIRFFEPMRLGDALWWSFSTATTVGYGDLAPRTSGGRMVACTLMVVGIGFISILTGTVASYLLHPEDRSLPAGPHPRGRGTRANPHVRTIMDQLERFDELTPREVEDLCRVLISLKESGGKTPSPPDSARPYPGELPPTGRQGERQAPRTPG